MSLENADFIDLSRVRIDTCVTLPAIYQATFSINLLVLGTLPDRAIVCKIFNNAKSDFKSRLFYRSSIVRVRDRGKDRK